MPSAMEDSPDGYSVPKESKAVFRKGILENPLIKPYLPKGWEEYADKIDIEGSDSPSFPINWRLAESIVALKAYVGLLVNAILKERYGLDPVSIKINTDHAQLYLVGLTLWTIDPTGQNIPAAYMFSHDPEERAKYERYFPNWDKHGAVSTHYRTASTNIYKAKDGWFHIHGSLNPDPTIKYLGLPHEYPAQSLEEACKPFAEAVAKHTIGELQDIASNGYHQAGTIVYSVDDYNNSEHGKANAHIGLFEIHHKPNATQKPCWWPESPATSPKRPLAGLKVVDFTRVIASPTISRELAELGASVMRVISPNLPDTSIFHFEFNHGKWEGLIDLNVEEDREKLRELIRDADVFVEGYRPFCLDKHGFGADAIHELVKDRPRGIIYARECCYGWNGPWKHLSGWQQISDACCGVSMEYGHAMGLDEPVTPWIPNSDLSTGVAGMAAILTALLQRAEKGGSYTVDLALNYYSRWLTSEVGTYPPAVWEKVWALHDHEVVRAWQPLTVALPAMMESVHKNCESVLLKPEFFTEYPMRYLDGLKAHIVAPILTFPDGEVEPGYQVSVRTNGVDKPKWPEDLSVEVVT